MRSHRDPPFPGEGSTHLAALSSRTTQAWSPIRSSSYVTAARWQKRRALVGRIQLRGGWRNRRWIETRLLRVRPLACRTSGEKAIDKLADLLDASDHDLTIVEEDGRCSRHAYPIRCPGEDEVARPEGDDRAHVGDHLDRVEQQVGGSRLLHGLSVDHTGDGQIRSCPAELVDGHKGRPNRRGCLPSLPLEPLACPALPIAHADVVADREARDRGLCLIERGTARRSTDDDDQFSFPIHALGGRGKDDFVIWSCEGVEEFREQGGIRRDVSSVLSNVTEIVQADAEHFGRPRHDGSETDVAELLATSLSERSLLPSLTRRQELSDVVEGQQDHIFAVDARRCRPAFLCQANGCEPHACILADALSAQCRIGITLLVASPERQKHDVGRSPWGNDARLPVRAVRSGASGSPEFPGRIWCPEPPKDLAIAVELEAPFEHRIVRGLARMLGDGAPLYFSVDGQHEVDLCVITAGELHSELCVQTLGRCSRHAPCENR